jgi:hypothetical protein
METMRFEYGAFLSSPSAAQDMYDAYSTLRRQFIETRDALLPAELRKDVQIEDGKLLSVIGRAKNDILRIEATHGIRASDGKKAAYLLRWMLLISPVFTTIPPRVLMAQSESVQDTVRKFKYLFCVRIAIFVMESLVVEKVDQRLWVDLIYYMRTGAYSEKMGALFFDSLTLPARNIN